MGGLHCLHSFVRGPCSPGTLPPSLAGMSLLTLVNISGNTEITGLLPGAFGSLTALYEWKSSGLSLTGIDPDFFSARGALTNLNLSFNLLHTLPDSIGSVGLVELSLSNNHLNTLPASLRSMSGLTHLDIAANALTTLTPPFLSSVSGIRAQTRARTGVRSGGSSYSSSSSSSSNSNNNNASAINHYADELANVAVPQRVRLSASDVATGFDALKHLDASGNLIGELPLAAFMELDELTSLNVSSNLLTGPLPAEIGSIKSLTVLDVSLNALDPELPPSICSLSRMLNKTAYPQATCILGFQFVLLPLACLDFDMTALFFLALLVSVLVQLFIASSKHTLLTWSLFCWCPASGINQAPQPLHREDITAEAPAMTPTTPPHGYAATFHVPVPYC